MQDDARRPYQSGGLRDTQRNLDQFTQAPCVGVSPEQENSLLPIPSNILSASPAWPSDSAISTITFMVPAEAPPRSLGQGRGRQGLWKSREGGTGCFPGGPEQPLPHPAQQVGARQGGGRGQRGAYVSVCLVGEIQVNALSFLILFLNYIQWHWKKDTISTNHLGKCFTELSS